jgi:HlyD family secretion protein
MKRIRILVGIVVLAAVGAGLWFWRSRGEAEAADRLVLYGNVDIRQVQLAFNGSERIAALLVQEGDRVKAGQLLAVLDTQRLEAKAGGKEAQVAAQHEVVARLEAGNRPEEIRKAKADMAVVEAEARNAQLTFQRVTNLQAQAVLPPQSLDDATAALNVANAKLSAAKQTYDLMVLGPRKEDIATSKATLQAYEADLALARRELADARLYAPANGVIRDRVLEPGDMASPQKPVFTLALDDPLWVRAYVAETDLGKIRLGMKAEVTTDSYPGKHYEAWIGFISPTAEFTPKSVETAEVRTKLVYQVRAFVRNPQGELRLGMPAVVTISLNSNASETGAPAQPGGAK